MCRLARSVPVVGGEVCLRRGADANVAFASSHRTFCCRCVSLRVWGCFSQPDGALGFPTTDETSLLLERSKSPFCAQKQTS